MKIAFDVSGTLLNGPEKVLKLYKWCERNGHDLTVWSNSYSYTQDVLKELGLSLNTKTMTKKYRLDYDDPFDIAVDDDDDFAGLLSANRVILVNQIPENEEMFAELIGGKNENSRV